MSATLKKVPERKCVGCNEKKPKNELIRIVRCAESGTIELDKTGKKNGRGAYLCKSEECLKKAIKSKGLERSFKMSIPKEVYAALEEEFINIEAE